MQQTTGDRLTPQSTNDRFTAMFRTVAQGVAALLLEYWAIIPVLGELGLEIDTQVLEGIVFAFLVALYTFTANFLETQVHRIFGLMSGVPKAPVYPESVQAAKPG